MKNIFLRLLFVIVVVNFSGLVRAQTKAASAAAITNLGTPVAAKIKGFTEAFCISKSKNLRVCKMRATGEHSYNGKFVLEFNGQKLREWDCDLTAQTTTKDFAVLQGDLDADGTTETIVANFTGQSNGLGVRYYELKIFPALQTNTEIKPLEIATEEFGTNGSFVRLPNAPEILFFATTWITSSDLDKKSGTYLQGKWFRYKNGLLEPADQPTMVRRLLGAFDKERTQNSAAEPFKFTAGTPYSWFANGKGRTINKDPEIYGAAEVVAEGTIAAIEFEKYKRDPDDKDSEEITNEIFVVQTNKGEKLTYLSNKGGDVETKIAAPKYFAKVGLTDKKFILPDGITPAAIFGAVTGCKIKIVSYKFDPEIDPEIVLWLQR